MNAGGVKWTLLPMVRISCPLLLGIIIQHFCPFPVYFGAIVSVLCCIALFVFSLLPLTLKYDGQMLRGIILQGLIFCCGQMISAIQGLERQKANSLTLGEELYMFTITETLVEREKTFSTLATAYSIDAETSDPLPGHCIIYLGKNAASKMIRPGQRFLASINLQHIQGPLNPGDIDFKTIYANKHRYYQAYIPANALVLIPGQSIPPWKKAIFRQRELFMHLLRTNIKDPASLGLAEAILLGYRADLSQDISQSYARTGVMHVIAISGLHLSLIFSILLGVFHIIPGIGRNPWLPLTLGIPLIWWFSMLTGASASVIRSAVMCSIPVLGFVLRRRARSGNILATSLVALIIINPQWIWDTGFQLSYAAVSGIMCYQRRIYALVHLSNQLAASLWNLVAVTLAAQVFTTPLVIYYFRQFPLLFLCTNLVAVPLSSIILISEILLCAMSPMSGLAARTGQLTETLIRFMNGFVHRMDQIPYSVVRDLDITAMDMIIIITCIVCVDRWLRSGTRLWVLIALSCVFFMISSQQWSRMQAENKAAVVILQIKGQTAIMSIQDLEAKEYFRGQKGYNPQGIVQATEKARTSFRVKKHQSTILSSHGAQWLKIGNQRILIVHGRNQLDRNPPSEKAGLILLTGNATITMAECLQWSATGLVVADGSNSLWKIQQWQKEAEKLPLRLHSTARQGAFQLDLNNPLRYAKEN